MWKISVSGKHQQGSRNIVSGNVDEKIRTNRKTTTNIKKHKYIHFFQNFKHIKQQHQINTLAHQYGKSTHIYNVGCQIKNNTS